MNSFNITNIVTVSCPMDTETEFYKDNYQSVVEKRYIPAKWRISGFYKTYLKKKPTNKFDEEFWKEEFDKKSVAEQLKSSFSKKIILCCKEEAEYVGLTGICGAIVPLEWLTYVDAVGWTPETILQHQSDYSNRVTNEDYIMMGLFNNHIDPKLVPYWRIIRNGGIEGNEDVRNGDYNYCVQWCNKFSDKQYFEMFNN